MYFFGCRFGQFKFVHDILDHPWQEVFGAEHRKLMHDSKTLEWIEANYGPAIAVVAKAHIALDIATTSMKQRGWR